MAALANTETASAQALPWVPEVTHSSGLVTELLFHLCLSTMVPAMLATGTLSNYFVCPHTLPQLYLPEWTH